jgi:uncharacterized RDD family membrane protein YckC
MECYICGRDIGSNLGMCEECKANRTARRQQISETPTYAACRVENEGAGFWIRLLAYTIDSYVINICVGLVVLLLEFLTISTGGLFSGLAQSVSDSFFSGNQVSIPLMFIAGVFSVFLAFLLCIITVGFLYFSLFESSSLMATPGKLLLGIQVSDEQGARLSFRTALLRTVAKVASMLIFGLGFVLVGIQPEKRGLHDLVAGTRVRKTPKCNWESIVLGVVLVVFLGVLNNFIQPTERNEVRLPANHGSAMSREDVERLFKSHQNQQSKRIPPVRAPSGNNMSK